MVYGCTREQVSIDGEDSGEIFDTELSVVPGDLYLMALTWPLVTCRHYNYWELIKNQCNVTYRPEQIAGVHEPADIQRLEYNDPSQSRRNHLCLDHWIFWQNTGI